MREGYLFVVELDIHPQRAVEMQLLGLSGGDEDVLDVESF